MFDIFFISPNITSTFESIKRSYPSIRHVKSLKEARSKSFTKMYWVIFPDMSFVDGWEFQYTVHPCDRDVVHIFRNTNNSYGICLIPKSLVITDAEEMGDFIHKKYIDVVTSSVKPLDVVFISNGEVGADDRLNYLKKSLEGYSNRLHVVSGIVGRNLAYKKAASLSSTRHFFAVFAKILVSDSFDWNWTPDAFQNKHHIFMAANPVNGLVYGHQAIIAYHASLVLANEGTAIDFTMSQPNTVVDTLCGIAEYNTSPVASWRTAFREVLKLKLYADRGDVEASVRLSYWLADSKASYGDWSQKGARDALSYYESVGGDYNLLLKSYEWEWLDAYLRNV